MALLDRLGGAFRGTRVLVTGHTGFKGAWLTTWLHSLGSEVIGVALPPDQGAGNLFDEAMIADKCTSIFSDIRDYESLVSIFDKHQPTIVFHLAAQPLVRRSYRDPIATFATNIMGTAHVLEAARLIDSVRSVVCVTTDKVYANKEWTWGYRECDEIGGLDPYSASKSAAEMVARTYMTSLSRSNPPYFVATARGGNVIGGGDWSEDRLVPDLVRAIERNEPLLLRNSAATRPWQHVLELCLGYLILATFMPPNDSGEPTISEHKRLQSFNFGPDATGERSVGDLVHAFLGAWNIPGYETLEEKSGVYESKYLKLDSSLAKTMLGWRPLLDFEETIHMTAQWYRDYAHKEKSAEQLIFEQITNYESCIRNGKM